MIDTKKLREICEAATQGQMHWESWGRVIDPISLIELLDRLENLEAVKVAAEKTVDWCNEVAEPYHGPMYTYDLNQALKALKQAERGNE